jgi:hypothetical protein
LQTSDALGAAAAQLGPDAQAAIVELNKQASLSHGKVTRCLESLFGIPLRRGGSVHTVLRAASRCQPVYEAIRQTVGQSPWVVPDETGWRVGGYLAWLHTVVGPKATAYVIDPTRSSAPTRWRRPRRGDPSVSRVGWLNYSGPGSICVTATLWARSERCRPHPCRHSRKMGWALSERTR